MRTSECDALRVTSGLLTCLRICRVQARRSRQVLVLRRSAANRSNAGIGSRSLSERELHGLRPVKPRPCKSRARSAAEMRRLKGVPIGLGVERQEPCPQRRPIGSGHQTCGCCRSSKRQMRRTPAETHGSPLMRLCHARVQFYRESVFEWETMVQCDLGGPVEARGRQSKPNPAIRSFRGRDSLRKLC